ncbi:MFS transporter [Parapedobacter indicus]|uniref:Predicted arabinose efflux permease, MFS family n=1 Tax=Parapedobacter indicus TaxID=1477437 RepID=A0A1I3FGI8_9SPHI|nr:MFS transporter [Parapedobacter indicus]PPL03716.1 putative MFS family arabinose efflux permease [Parapedobacter indicus]SFI10348.1 Predicted arabinose efflux permease, MFS family [Parapedobacter indicus]
MNIELNKRRLYNAACLSLVVTAMTFSIRAGLLGTIGNEFNLNPTAVGQIAAAAFWGFTIAMFIGGPLCDWLGLGRMYLFAFCAHFLGIILTIFSSSYWPLFFSTLLVGIGNGFIESASYTMVSSMYPSEKTKKINDWHIWFPGGIVIGGVLAWLFSLAAVDWKIQMAVMIVPTIIYGVMFYKQVFPKSERVTLGISNAAMIKACFHPLFILMVFCMLLTAATELGTNQWIAELLSGLGIPSILLLVFINGIMAIGRANAGFVLTFFSSAGLLLVSAVFAFAGLLWLGYAQGYTAFAAAGVFAVGICFFWPTMIGFIAENLYRTGPLGLSIMGGTGLMSTALVLPIMGGIYADQLTIAEHQLQSAGVQSLDLMEQVKMQAGASTLQIVAILPAVLIVCFGFLYIYMKKKKSIYSDN